MALIVGLLPGGNDMRRANDMRRVSVRVDDTLYERLNRRALGADRTAAAASVRIRGPWFPYRFAHGRTLAFWRVADPAPWFPYRFAHGRTALWYGIGNAVIFADRIPPKSQQNHLGGAD